MPLRDSFEAVYERALWGAGTDAPSSGGGSTLEYATSYARLVGDVLAREGAASVVDLGCGDFSVGRRIAEQGVHYIGVDIVPSVIRRNTGLYAGENVTFMCLDLASEQPPAADLALLRQVLQHLSNDEIRHVLRGCVIYPTLLVTEHVPPGSDWQPNVDKPHGPDIRLYDRSGVVLEAPPFSVPVEEIDVVPYAEEMGGVLRTVLVRGRDLAFL